MCSGILLSPIGEIANDTVDVLRSRHKYIHGLKTWLLLAVRGNALDHYGCQWQTKVVDSTRVAAWSELEGSMVWKGIIRRSIVIYLEDEVDERVTFSSRISNCLRTVLSSF